jgi:hypothetical protein
LRPGIDSEDDEGENRVQSFDIDNADEVFEIPALCFSAREVGEKILEPTHEFALRSFDFGFVRDHWGMP